MPRESSSSKMTPMLVPPIERPLAPESLTAAQVVIWHKLTDDLHPSRFDGCFLHLTEAIARHTDYAKRVGDECDKLLADPGVWDNADKRAKLRTLQRDHSIETQRMACLMGQARLLPTSRYFRTDPKLRPVRTGPKPWTDWGNDPKKPAS